MYKFLHIENVLHYSLEKFADDITAYPYGLNFTSDELITINKLNIYYRK